LIKKIIIIGIIGFAIILGIALSFSNNTVEENNDETTLVIKGDVVMPTKVSRPGCEIDDRCYAPSLILTKKGNSVTWVNEDSAFHSVTSGFYDSPTELFDSGHLDPFESFTFTFDEVGDYDYFCTLHPWMEGLVTVE
jgi:plastocyanin